MELIQVGVIAARAPDGSFLPSVPIWEPATPEAVEAEEAGTALIGRIFAERYAQYLRETGQMP